MRTILVLAVLALTPSPTFAQDDAHWLPWLGCWDSYVERLAGDSARVCIVPSGAGVKMLTVLGDEISTDQTIIADSTDRAVDEAPCTGVKRAEWSHDGNLLFTRAEVACENRPRQKVLGLHLFANGPVWLDIQVVEAAGRENVLTRRYQRASVPESLADVLPGELVARAARAAQELAVRPPTISDVIEASGKVASAAIEAALFETKTQFALNSRALITLDKGGVSERLIDLMLAISFPSHFEVNRWAAVPFAQSSLGDSSWYGDASWADVPFGHPTWRSHWLSDFRYYQSPYNYSGWNLYYFPRGNSGAPAGSFTISAPLAPGQSGSVVKGQGYTRSRPTDLGSAGESTDQSSSSRGTSSVVGPRASSSGDSSAGSAHGGASSSGGYSSGSDGGSGGGGSGSGGGGGGGGRTAVERE